MDDLAAAMPAGLVRDRLVAATEKPASRSQLDNADADADAFSCFGVHWLLVDGEAYLGQDRLNMLERRLAV